MLARWEDWLAWLKQLYCPQLIFTIALSLLATVNNLEKFNFPETMSNRTIILPPRSLIFCSTDAILFLAAPFVLTGQTSKSSSKWKRYSKECLYRPKMLSTSGTSSAKSSVAFRFHPLTLIIFGSRTLQPSCRTKRELEEEWISSLYNSK